MFDKKEYGKLYRQHYKKEFTEYKKRYRIKHKTEVDRYDKLWNTNNRHHRLLFWKQHRLKNREWYKQYEKKRNKNPLRIAWKKQYYKINREKIVRKCRKWRLNHQQEIEDYNKNYNFRRRIKTLNKQEGIKG
jgi:hypothetical protein